ncbi:MAG TPA: hypothetical protein PKH74_05375 [Candidatus Bipolaricaulis anaerobius]|jgi:hypothetical protein|nr:hypothetical protein [Candidatus Bipolaricaulis anaerobius]
MREDREKIRAFAESEVEAAALGWLESLGWAIRRGPSGRIRVNGVEQFSKEGE